MSLHVDLRRPHHDTLRTQVLTAPPYRLFVALWGGLAAVDVGRAAHASPTVQVALLALLVGACSVGQRPLPALTVAGVAWLVATGFVAHDDGRLALSGSADAVRLTVLAGVALLATEVRR
ncbi:hypothetical protein H5V45_10615 [Nocardioides sp. KIGAM211]|uniref:Uncharacterized protein n=1 Tax=Nocardioides luti TaxID=2761101 RepID=A0A7X0RIP9_9ACTN|nr:hypothetical protein [Nocardioides luti]MBB6627773.1 hypothetical protein [Nocardioides luti]